MLEALGNLGDFIGGIAVVITLIYLAVQVRQNTLQLRDSTKLARIQARDVAFQNFSDFRSKIVSNGDVAEIYLKGLRDPKALEPAERLRFNLLANELFYMLQTSLQRAIELGGADPDESIRELVTDSVLRAPGIRIWWNEHRGEFQPGFVAKIDARFESATEER